LSPTGDGLLTGLIVADLVVRRGPLSHQAASAWQRVPQALINIANDDYDDHRVEVLFRELMTSFGLHTDDVRLLVRASGTEPVVRIMVEALDGDFVEEFTKRIEEQFAR
jgi:phosphoglucosamine mutase